VLCLFGAVIGGAGKLPDEVSPAEESAGAGDAIVEAASERVTRLGGVLAKRRPPAVSPSSHRMPEPNIGDRNSYGFRCR